MAKRRQKRVEGRRDVMSVNPPREVGGVLGGFRTVALSQAIRMAAQFAGQAGVEVAGQFTPEEWSILAEAIKDRVIEPEQPEPGQALARLIERQASQFGVGPKGEKGGKALAAFTARVADLDYVHAWAVILAIQAKHDYMPDVPEGEPWWEVPYRRRKIEEAEQKGEG